MPGKKKTLEDFEAKAMDSLVDMPLATIDTKDDCGSKYFIKYIFNLMIYMFFLINSPYAPVMVFSLDC